MYTICIRVCLLQVDSWAPGGLELRERIIARIIRCIIILTLYVNGRFILRATALLWPN